MKIRSTLGFFFITIIPILAYTQEPFKLPKLNIGDSAPPLFINEWLKGDPVHNFKNGQVYVIEFWATWCVPCKAAMPRLSDLAREYRKQVTVISIDIYEQKTTPKVKIKSFVDSMSNKMDYTVAIGDSSMVTEWIEAADEKNKGIPVCFVVNANGRIAWCGFPYKLDTILPRIVNNDWDLKNELALMNFNRKLAYLDHEADLELVKYTHENPLHPEDHGKPDSTLYLIKQIIEKEPALKYAPRISENTFSALLQTNPNKAYEYGKVAMFTYTYEEPNYYAIIDAVKKHSSRLNLPQKIYELGVEAYQAQIDHYPYPELLNLPNRFNQMAFWQWQAGNQKEAIQLQEKAIELLKNKKGYPKAVLDLYLLQLKQYMQS